jgi:hypothetical protein
MSSLLLLICIAANLVMGERSYAAGGDVWRLSFAVAGFCATELVACFFRGYR